MKPKEKAEKLVKKFEEHSWISDLEGYEVSSNFESAKHCALIAVDEVLNASPSLPILSDSGGFGDDINLSTEWWKQVKIEIEKL